MNLNLLIRGTVLVAVGAALLTGCKHEPHFTVKGKIEGAADSTLLLFKRGITGADFVDSVKIGKDGTFKLEAPAPEFPDLYVLRLGKQMINLAVDSVDMIDVEAKMKDFATGYQLKGSPQSELIRQLYLKELDAERQLQTLKTKLAKKEIADSAYTTGVQNLANAYRGKAEEVILGNLRDLSAYFALFQKVNGLEVFDPLEKKDSRLFGAVATAWDAYHAKSPRAEHLKKFTLNAIGQRRALEGGGTNQLEATKTTEESEFFNISLPGKDDRKVELKSLKGKVVLLDFTSYQAEEAPGHNIALNKVYQQYKDAGFTIYQVSFSTPIQLWKTSAGNLPWVCVHEDNANTDLVGRFNLQALPTMYLINRQGEISKRVEGKDDLGAEVKKLL